jgi:endo-1,4-beta-xylanase
MARRRIAPSLAILATLAACTLPLLASSPAQAATPLRTLAVAKGKFIGFAAATGPLASEPAYSNIAATEFNQVTPENAMKWDATEPNDNQYNFSGADQIVAFAQANNQVVHGHTLVWHSQTPGWVQGLNATAMRAAMQDHITTVVGHFANNPVVQSWDVVNEVFDDNGNMRTSFWFNTLGQGYIADAFRMARAADPDAKLCINDYNVEGINAKSTAMFNLVQSLKAQGVPIDCVGFQAHLAIQFGFPAQIAENIARFAGLGVTVRFTELDVRMQLPRDASKDQQQSTYYTNIVNACLAATACSGVTIWGFTDKYSWVPNTFQGQGAALIYDENYSPKPAYTAINTALGGTTGGDTTPPSAPTGLTAGTPTTTSVPLSWTASTDNVGVTGYDILRAPGTSGGTFAQVGTSTTTSFTAGSLTAGIIYRFQVRARDAAGNTSAVSNTVTVTTQTGGGSGGCSATGTVQTQWQNGYVIQPLTITNTGTSTINGWTVTVILPAGHTLTGSWNATVTTSGQTVTFKNLSWNGTLAPGTSTASVGFQASRPNGNTALPTGYSCTSP